MIVELLDRVAYLVDSTPRRLFRMFFPEKIGPNDHLWSKYDPIFPPKVRLVDGSWSGNGQLWCRHVNGAWEYRQDEETAEEQMNRIA